MLQLIRERAQGWIAAGIILIIVLTLTFFGIGDTGRGGSADAISVNGVGISKDRINYEVQRLQANLAAQGQADLYPEEVVRNQVVRKLLIEELLRQAMTESHMTISNQAVMNIIFAEPDFQIDGKFSEAVFKAQINSAGYSQKAISSCCASGCLMDSSARWCLVSNS